MRRSTSARWGWGQEGGTGGWAGGCDGAMVTRDVRGQGEEVTLRVLVEVMRTLTRIPDGWGRKQAALARLGGDYVVEIGAQNGLPSGFWRFFQS